MVKGICNTAEGDTTSEPRGRNAPPGAPVKASMSGSQWLQPGWNRGIRIRIPPLIFQGVGIFYTFLPNQKGGIPNGKRKSVHL